LLISSNEGLAANVAASIRQAASFVVFDSLAKWNITRFNPLAKFSASANGLTITGNNNSLPKNNSTWFWGDGQSSGDSNSNVTHTYATYGIYTITLVSTQCFLSDSQSIVLPVFATSVENGFIPHYFSVHPNPCRNNLWIHTASTLPANIVMLDMMGHIVMQTSFIGNTILNLEQVAKGIYFLKISMENQQVFLQKISKE
jgi:hypothetical protein